MTDIAFHNFVGDFVRIIRDWAPKDTGNLRFNGIQYVFENGIVKKAIIFVDPDIAPYMLYTNEPWTSTRWNGKQNPNESWFNDAAEYAIKTLSAKYGGVFRKGNK
jgi:hypothetical protein